MRRRIGRIDDADAEPLAAGWLCSPIYGLITAPNSGITGQWLGKFLISDIVAHQATKTSWMKIEGQVWWPWIGQQAPSIHHCIESTCIIVILLVVSLLSYPQNPKDSPKPYHVLSMLDIPRLHPHSELNPNACYPSVTVANKASIVTRDRAARGAGEATNHFQLVVWNMAVIFPYIANDNPNWRTHIFQRGG